MNATQVSEAPTSHAFWVLGGVLNNFAEDINNRGEVVGGSDVSGDSTSRAFLWTAEHPLIHRVLSLLKESKGEL